ncbi:MAG: hypothetical protein ABL966_04815, partial [Acidimicrobiales bacterium]
QPVDVVELDVAPEAVKDVVRDQRHDVNSFGLSLQRDLRMAIAEYAPGSEVAAVVRSASPGTSARRAMARARPPRTTTIAMTADARRGRARTRAMIVLIDR